MANSYNPEFTLTLQGCYITVMVFVVYIGVRMFFPCLFFMFSGHFKNLILIT